jgi:hypothetical protein
MGIGKDHAFGGKLVDVRGPDLSILWVQALYVPVSEVITNDVHEIRLFLSRSLKKKGQKKQR